MPFSKRVAQMIVGVSLVLAGCTSTDNAHTPETPQAAAPAPAKTAQRRAHAPAASLDAYKKQVAQRIYDASGDTFEGRLPPMLKSVVVLNVTVDESGRATKVKVRRSNGFKHLERVALNSVRKAGPLPQPSATVLAGGKSVTYLETWLFRADGKFQIRSLVTEPQPGAEALARR